MIEAPGLSLSLENMSDAQPALTWTVLPDLDSPSKIGLTDDELQEVDELAVNSHDEAHGNVKRPRSDSQYSHRMSSTKKLRLSGPRRAFELVEPLQNLATSSVNELEAALNRSFLAPASSSKAHDPVRPSSISNNGPSVVKKPNAIVQTQLPRSWFKSLVPPPTNKSSSQSASTSNINHSRSSNKSSNALTITIPPFRKSNRPQRANKANVAGPSLPPAYEATIDELETWTKADVEPAVFTGKPRYAQDFLHNLAEADRSNLRHLLSTDEVPTAKMNRTHNTGRKHFVAVPEIPRSVRCRQLIESIFGESTSVSYLCRPFFFDVLTRLQGTPSREKTPSNDSRASSVIKETMETTFEELETSSNPEYGDPSSNFDHDSRPITPLHEQPPTSTSPSSIIRLVWSPEPRSITESSEAQSHDEPTLEQLLDELPVPKDHLHPSLDREFSDSSSFPDTAASQIEDRGSTGIVSENDIASSHSAQPPPEIIEIVSPMVYELEYESFSSIPSAFMHSIPTPIPEQNTLDPAEIDTLQIILAGNHDRVVKEHAGLASTLTQKLPPSPPFDDIQHLKDPARFRQSPIETMDLDRVEDIIASASKIHTSATSNVTDPSAPNDLPTPNHDSTPRFILLPNMLDISKSKLSPQAPHADSPYLFRDHRSLESLETSVRAPVPTIFDAVHLKSSVDLWSQDHVVRALEALVDSDSVIVQLRDDVEMHYIEAEIEDVDVEDEVDELRDDDELDSLPPSSPSKPMPPSQPRPSSERRMSIDSFQTVDEPTEFADQVEQWSTALKSLLKGKKKFQEQVCWLSFICVASAYHVFLCSFRICCPSRTS